MAVREDGRRAVLLPVDPGDVPALSLRSDHAPRLEGLHPDHAGMDRVSRRDDADALGRAVPLTSLVEMRDEFRPHPFPLSQDWARGNVVVQMAVTHLQEFH